jgi:hypothetical protein
MDNGTMSDANRMKAEKLLKQCGGYFNLAIGKAKSKGVQAVLFAMRDAAEAVQS